MRGIRWGSFEVAAVKWFGMRVGAKSAAELRLWASMKIRIGLLLGMALGVSAQNETELRRVFEGMRVVALLDMPAASSGVDIVPGAEIPLDFRKLGDGLKRFGVGVHEGDKVMVTKVLVKKDCIEFQLGGGGFGTLKDWWRTPSAGSSSYRGKSSYERDLERRVGRASGEERDRLQRELNRARSQRYRDSQLAEAVEAQNRLQREEWIQNERAKDGSRFNIRYPQGVPEGAATPEEIRRVLSKYLQFPE